MKILWHSNAPWAQTGYGQQTAMFCPRLKALGHDVAISAVWGLGGAATMWDHDILVYPQDDRWGKALLTSYAKHFQGADEEEALILTLMDVYPLTHDALADARVACWVPVDHEPLPPRVYEFFARTGARPIAMSRFGEGELRNAGLDALYVPHGVDTNVFFRKDNREAIRRTGMGLPEDAFVVGMVANNKGVSPPRKAFPQVFQAFAELRRRHSDAFLYMHSEMQGRNSGMNLAALADACNIPADAMTFSDQVMIEVGIPPDDMSYLYSGFDVLAHPSYGEGFGIPIIEAQACGCPVIVTNTTSMPELLGAGWLVEGDPYYDAPHGSFYKSPSVAEILDAMEEAYQGAQGNLSEKAVDFASQYGADLVTEQYWVPVLAELEGPREVLPLDGNRPKFSVPLQPLAEGQTV